MCKKTKIGMILFLAVILGVTFCACALGGSGGTDEGGSGRGGSGEADAGAVLGSGSQGADDGSAGSSEGGDADAGTAQNGGSAKRVQNGGYDLTCLCEPEGESACSSQDGYYYLMKHSVELPDGDLGSQMMYMDYASQKEIYLCSTAGCSHDTADCPAVFPDELFPAYSSRLFLYRDALYILNRQYDDEGTMSMDVFQDELTGPPASRPAALYRANLDGTNRQKVYDFPEDLTLEDLVLGDENGIYLITKKLSVKQEDGMTYHTASERKLMCLEPDTGTLTEVCPMDFEGNISWRLIGAWKSKLILSGIDYGREYTREEYWDDDLYKELYSNSQNVVAAFDLSDGSMTELTRQSNREEHSEMVVGNVLYISKNGSGEIRKLDLDTREEATLCTLSQNLILDHIGDTLCCREWDLSKDHTWYFVDTKTGEVSHSPLVNLCNGWNLEFRVDVGEDVLVIYDYDADDHGDGSYEIFQNKYALISKEDLLAGRDNYRKIDMIGKGM